MGRRSSQKTQSGLITNALFLSASASSFFKLSETTFKLSERGKAKWGEAEVYQLNSGAINMEWTKLDDG